MTATIKINTQYLDQRLTELGIDDAGNNFHRVWYQDSSEKDDDGNVSTKSNRQDRDYKLFDADYDGNILIRYFNLDGQPYRFKKDDAKMPVDFVRIRLRDPDKDMKYTQPKGSPVFPYFPPEIIKKYQAACDLERAEVAKVGQGVAGGEDTESIRRKKDYATIHTLFMVEGEFKAFKGCMSGIDIIGLPGIFGFYNGDLKGKLHDDIQELIIKCKVEKVVLLFDADLLTVKWAEGKDLAKRPMSFHGSIKTFRESLQLLMDDDKLPLNHAYTMHIKPKFLNEAKGLDDLLCKYEAQTVEIAEDLHSLQLARKYFDGFIINDLNRDVAGKMWRYLGLSDEQEFYKTYKDSIQALEFKFNRRRYIYDNEKKEVVFVRHEDADKFMRIGPDWVKIVSKLNKFGEKEEEIVSWKISEIQRDYKKYPDFLEQVMKYDDFCNEPNWGSDYKRVIEGCYNLCEPLRWKPNEGAFPNTIKFLKHLFQGKGQVHLDDNGRFLREEGFTGDQFTVALDYLTLLLRNPKQMLPVPCLVSPENETGKSTFLKWLQMIFGANSCVLGNEQFKMRFNGHYITKYIIGIDESFLEVDKKAEKERLKQLVTTDTVYLENKGMNVRKIAYYGKVILVSNDADRIMKIDEGETRWFVVRVPQIPRVKLSGRDLIERGYKSLAGKEIDTDKMYEVPNIDPDMEVKMKNEIEAFLHFIYNRSIFHPRVSRLWFDPEWLITDQYKRIVAETKSRIDRVVEDWVIEQFIQYPEHDSLQYTPKYLTDQLNLANQSKYKIDALDVKAYLKSRNLFPSEKPLWIKIPIGFENDGNLVEPGAHDNQQKPRAIYRSFTGRAYTFRREEWTSENEGANLLGGKEPESGPPTDVSSEKTQVSGVDDLPF